MRNKLVDWFKIEFLNISSCSQEKISKYGRRCNTKVETRYDERQGDPPLLVGPLLI